LLHDQRFAEMYTASRTARGFGPQKIRVELKQRGVAIELVDACCDESDPAWRDHALKAWKKRFSNTPADSFNAWAKQARHLQQRGFTTSQIHAALGEYEQ
jgi:regulatory protein